MSFSPSFDVFKSTGQPLPDIAQKLVLKVLADCLRDERMVAGRMLWLHSIIGGNIEQANREVDQPPRDLMRIVNDFLLLNLSFIRPMHTRRQWLTERHVEFGEDYAAVGLFRTFHEMIVYGLDHQSFADQIARLKPF